MKKQTHSRMTAEGRAVWYTERLWGLSAGLPVKRVRIDQIKEFDMDCWFGVDEPTCREVARHAKKIFEADLSYPIILSADGRLMDGGHRIAKAWINGLHEVTAVQFADDPAPDFYRPELEPEKAE
ncbi:MAG TPA: hypothetical protein PLN52_25790 [Opitutaceae bacterium]|nr:hypothetical protein [Opitutaceae bacterium]